MNRCHENSWFRTGLLLSALMAGGMATLFVPPYREIAWAPDDEEEAVSAPASPGRYSSGMTGIDVDMLSLDFVRSIG